MAARTDSATYGLVVLVVGTILVPCLSAPLHAADDVDLSVAWWYNACSHPTRHNGLAKLKVPNCNESEPKNPKYVRDAVRRQINHFKNFYRHEMQHFTTLYQAHVQIPMANESLLLFTWLPKPEPFKRDRTLGEALVKLHEDLQRYAVAIHKLERLEVHTHIPFDLRKRKDALLQVARNLQLLLCEIETAVNQTCQPLPKRISPSFPDGTDADTDITKKSDLTVLISQEWSVLTRLSKFVRGTHRSFKQILRSGNERPADDEEGAASDSSAANGSGEG